MSGIARTDPRHDRPSFRGSLMKPQTQSRRAILDRIDSWTIDPPPLPEIDTRQLSRFDDPLAKFEEMLAMVGGESHRVDSYEEARQRLEAIDAFAASRRTASVVPEVVPGNVDLRSIDDPHALASLDWMIASGEFAVAENGAIWITSSSLPHRVLLFIAQYLVIAVSRSQIVHNMHEAYDRIGRPEARFGIFVSGPSKTADIEQSLVLGAHGCRTLQVLLLP